MKRTQDHLLEITFTEPQKSKPLKIVILTSSQQIDKVAVYPLSRVLHTVFSNLHFLLLHRHVRLAHTLGFVL